MSNPLSLPSVCESLAMYWESQALTAELVDAREAARTVARVLRHAASEIRSLTSPTPAPDLTALRAAVAQYDYDASAPLHFAVQAVLDAARTLCENNEPEAPDPDWEHER